MKCPSCGREVKQLIEIEEGIEVCEDCRKLHFYSIMKKFEEEGLIEHCDGTNLRLTEKGKTAPDDVFQEISEIEAKALITNTMKRTDIDPAKIYAWEKTGLPVTTKTADLFEPKELEAWDQAIKEYYRIKKRPLVFTRSTVEKQMG